MSWDSKVLWTEGLFLQPHHFQQADRHAESMRAGLARRLVPYAWGVSDLEIDEEILKVGQFAVKSCSGLMPDGTVFRVPGGEDHPPALDVPANTKDCVVYLSIPQRRQGALEIDASGVELSAARLRASHWTSASLSSETVGPCSRAFASVRASQSGRQPCTFSASARST